jgi:hypothetical protein
LTELVHDRAAQSDGLLDAVLRMPGYEFRRLRRGGFAEFAGPRPQRPTPGISREVERALRNMTKLRRKRAERKPDGTLIPGIDYARELAVMVPDVKALTAELLARMEMHKRDRRDM